MGIQVIITAAGIGTRLGLGIPKPLVKIKDKLLIDYQIELIDKLKIPKMRIVVGYRKELIIEHISKHPLKDRIIIIENKEYKTTGPSYSVALGAKGITDDILILDGDVLCNSLDISEHFIAVTPISSEQPVRANVEEGKVISFEKGDYEWGCVCLMPANFINPNRKYIYESLITFLPVKAQMINSVEIDTQNDLKTAERWLDGQGIY